MEPPRIKVRKKEELWLYSLTDLTFILMAFFALMLSMSKPDRQQFDEVVAKVQADPKAEAPPQTLSLVAENLEKIIKKEQLHEDAQVKIDANGLLLEFSEKLLFPSGSSQLNTNFEQTADRLLKVLTEAPDRFRITIEGHSDDQQIQKKGVIRSNWDLSARRAIAMLESLKKRGLDQNRMRIVALADTVPKVQIKGLAAADLADARRKNRRVVIRLD